METWHGFAVNLYEDLTAKGILHIEGGYPSNGKIRIILDRSGEFELALRIPKKFGCKVNGLTVPAGEYYRIKRDWNCGDFIEMEFDMTLRTISDKTGEWIAYEKGPLVMCREYLPDGMKAIEYGTRERVCYSDFAKRAILLASVGAFGDFITWEKTGLGSVCEHRKRFLMELHDLEYKAKISHMRL